MKFRVWLGRNSENNKALSFMGRDGLNQRSRGYWHKVFWFGPVFFSIVSDKTLISGSGAVSDSTTT